jgi:hypothetical protein
MHAGNASPIRGDRVFGPTVVAPFEIFFAEPRIQLMDFMYEEIGGESGVSPTSYTYRRPFYSSVCRNTDVCLFYSRFL